MLHAMARADVYRVDLFASASNYTGPCPIDIVFTATVDGDPGTVFSTQYSGTVFPASKKLYHYVPDARTISLDDDISIDAAHAGSFERTVEVDDYGPASHVSSSPLRTMKANAEVVVTCVAPGNGATAPSPSATPTTSTNAAAGAPSAAAGTSTAGALLGVSVGGDPAIVLARLHLHPPGWAKSPVPSGSTETAELREFDVDETTDMLLVFDKTIEVVLIRSAHGTVSTAEDPFGVKIGTPVEKLEALRGQPTLIVTGGSCSDNCRATDEMSTMNGLHDPVESDRTMIFGAATAVRWEYALKNDAVVSIRVVDCRVSGVCPSGPTPHP
jgi:hypothetical protein